MRTTLAALLVLVTAGTAAADAHNEVMVGSYTRALRASSANAVTENSLGGGVLGYARELDLGLMPKLQTWATAGFAWGEADGTMFSTLTTHLATQTFSFGGRAQYNVFRYLAVGGRLDLGPSRAGLTRAGSGRQTGRPAAGCHKSRARCPRRLRASRVRLNDR